MEEEYHISTVERIQYGFVTLSLKEEAHLQYSGWCVVQISHLISTDEGVQYRTAETVHGAVGGCIYLAKMIFYRQCYRNLDFVLLWLSDQDFAEIPLGC